MTRITRPRRIRLHLWRPPIAIAVLLCWVCVSPDKIMRRRCITVKANIRPSSSIVDTWSAPSPEGFCRPWQLVFFGFTLVRNIADSWLYGLFWSYWARCDNRLSLCVIGTRTAEVLRLVELSPQLIGLTGRPKIRSKAKMLQSNESFRQRGATDTWWQGHFSE